MPAEPVTDTLKDTVQAVSQVKSDNKARPTENPSPRRIEDISTSQLFAHHDSIKSLSSL